MLQPREADLPVLFLVFIVLPVLAYFLLGRCHHAVSKKARVSVLAQRAAEDTFRAETMACPDVILPGPSLRSLPYLRPASSLRHEYHECATCHAPAKTRCSRCKSVRYCSGKCQIIHWRQGHKETCQKWHGSGASSSGGPATEASEHLPVLSNLNSPLPGGDIYLHDMNFDTVSEPSFPTTDNYNLDTDPFPLDRSNMIKSNQSLHTSEYGAVGVSCEKNNYSVDEEIRPSEILSVNKVSNNNFGSDAKSGNCDATYPVKSIAQQPSICAPETRKRPKASITVYEPDMGVYLISDMISSCEGPYASAAEPLQRSLSSGKTIGKEDVVHKRPPYPSGRVAQKPLERVSTSHQNDGHEKNPCSKNDQRSTQTSVSTSSNLQGCDGISKLGASKVEVLKKPSKFLKTSLVGLINDNKRSKVLFPYEDLVKFFEYDVRGISPRGLFNCGNSCYANAVLQCLMCTKPLMIYLLLRLHSKDCCSKNWCLICELEQYASTLREGGGPLSPSRILSNLRNIGCRLGGGTQEDAHEFLRHLVMSMQAACLDGLGGEKHVEQSFQETTLIQQMFGGRLKSKVKCLRCYHESERYENIMDLTLEIHGWVESLQDALTQFTAPEDLDGENMYKCGRCSAYVKARKQLSVHEVPNILTLVLKRFQTGKYGKINKCVTFPDMLDMVPFVTGSGDNPPLYFLYAVVVHVDTENASFSGHYISYVKDMQGTWLRIDDSEVQVVSVNQVMSEGAYMLFYLRSFPRPPRIYIEKGLLPVPTSVKHHTSKSSKGSKQECKQTDLLFSANEQTYGIYDFRPEGEGYMQDQHAELRARNFHQADDAFADSVSTDFSEATSSEWSLFTSSDESSFTTESTRDSFSVVDYGDNAGLDPISSIFGPCYAPDHPPGNFISCTRFSPSNPQTRYFPESTGFVLDSSMPTHPHGNVHRGRYPDRACASSAEPLSSAHQRSVYGRYALSRDGFVQTSGFCQM
ncbi:ubiquitin C-terminal hydrolase 15-like [Phragmites australis]|uniref:ubiquitin C-terminal hydrolase 15-like n=1 Tax=Phragmites australis TaxID=29695 RepID=UPI002D788F6D|nr:ubiquitin C-terminal hydrolase 15-like [Phragmites australis]XP_062223626.1 ubiquitin C-terminal hydrolase 15-like [Phragmites australis]